MIDWLASALFYVAMAQLVISVFGGDREQRRRWDAYTWGVHVVYCLVLALAADGPVSRGILVVMAVVHALLWRLFWRRRPPRRRRGLAKRAAGWVRDVGGRLVVVRPPVTVPFPA